MEFGQKWRRWVMANSLNVRLINEVTDIAQGDNASTVVLELLDENKLVMPYLDGESALINFINKRNEIQYQYITHVFDSRIEFNVDSVIPNGIYYIEIRIRVDGFTYVFPSSVDYKLRINKSANEFYNIVIDKDGVDVVVSEVYRRLDDENPGLLEHVNRIDNPHQVTKDQVGLGNVDDVQQASKEDFDNHVNDAVIHVTSEDKTNWNSKATQQDIDEAIGGLDYVSNLNFTNHLSDEDVHLKEGERELIQQEIDAKSNTAEQNAITYADTIKSELDTHKQDDSRHITELDRQKLDTALHEETDIAIQKINQSIEIYSVTTYKIGKLLHFQIHFSTTGLIQQGSYIFSLPEYKSMESYMNILKVYNLEEMTSTNSIFASQTIVAMQEIPASRNLLITGTVVVDKVTETEGGTEYIPIDEGGQ